MNKSSCRTRQHSLKLCSSITQSLNDYTLPTDCLLANNAQLIRRVAETLSDIYMLYNNGAFHIST